jgi:PAS domain S-box-containing protein
MTKLVEHLFRLPIAHVALLQADFTVSTRIGSGQEHWENLNTFPVLRALGKPIVWPGPSGSTFTGFIPGELRFVAAVPLRSSDDLELGLLIVGDVVPHPEFSRRDCDTLAELAGVLAGKMELRMLACEARESESEIREAERRFRNIANSAPVMIIYSGVDGGCSFVNKTWLEFTGRDLTDELGDGYADTFHPDYRDGIAKAYWSAFTERKPVSFEFPMRRHDGEYRWMEARGAPRFRDDGGYAGYIGCFVDLTDQRSVIAEIRKQILCTTAVADAAKVFYLILDPAGRIQNMSALCRRTSGRDPDQMRGRFLWEVCDAAVPPEGAVREAIYRVTSGETTVHTYLPALSPAGEDVADLLWRFTPIRSEHDELIAIVATTSGLAGEKGSGTDCHQRHCACGPSQVYALK